MRMVRVNGEFVCFSPNIGSTLSLDIEYIVIYNKRIYDQKNKLVAYML